MRLCVYAFMRLWFHSMRLCVIPRLWVYEGGLFSVTSQRAVPPCTEYRPPGGTVRLFQSPPQCSHHKWCENSAGRDQDAPATTTGGKTILYPSPHLSKSLKLLQVGVSSSTVTGVVRIRGFKFRSWNEYIVDLVCLMCKGLQTIVRFFFLADHDDSVGNKQRTAFQRLTTKRLTDVLDSSLSDDDLKASERFQTVSWQTYGNDLRQTPSDGGWPCGQTVLPDGIRILRATCFNPPNQGTKDPGGNIPYRFLRG